VTLSFTDVQCFEQQYELRPGRNVIVFAAALPPGRYDVRYGVYRLAELSQQYPPWYSTQCSLVVE